MELTFDDYEEVPDGEHIELVIDGLVDAVTGNEGMGLTKAQVYLQAALYASGEIRSIPHPDVAGNESFFGSIGSGFQAAWEYIKKMFNGIFNFFFKKDNKAQEEKAKVSLDKAEASIKAVEKGNIPEAQVTATIAKTHVHIERLPESPQKKTLEHKLEAIKLQESKPAQARELSNLLPEVFKADMLDRGQIKAKHDQIETAVRKLEDRKAAYEQEGDKREEWAMDIQTYLNGLIGLPAAFESVKDLASAKAWVAKSRRCMEAMKNNLENFRTREADFKRRISDLESAMMSFGKDQTAARKANPALVNMKKALVSVSAIIHTAGQIREAITETGAIIDKACISVL